MKPITLTLFTVMILAVASQHVFAATETQKPLVEKVEDLELAKVILKANPKILAVKNDPFKPITTKNAFDPTANIVMNPADLSNQVLADAMGNVNVVGIVRMDQDYRAFITTSDKKGVYKAQDKSGNYTIERIEPTQVVFKLGENEIVKKRGQL